MSASYPEGTTAQVTDDPQRSLVKIVELLSTGAGGGGVTANVGGFLDPNGNVTGSVGDTYYSRFADGGDGSTWFKGSGTATNTGWND